MMNNEQHTPAASAAPEAPFQARVQPWMMACFGMAIAADIEERNHRFLEESLELVQASGCTASEAHQLVDYVYGRPVGELRQEIGGVMVTLAALCLAHGEDLHAAGETELARIWTKVEAIRAKQAAKPKHSPLPAAAPQVVADERDSNLSQIADNIEEAVSSLEGDFVDAITGHIEAIRAALAAATVQAQEPRKPTDLSARLRNYIDQNLVPFPSDVLAAADEIERYYGGMMNWKATAEAKDHTPVQPVAVPDGDLPELPKAELTTDMHIDGRGKAAYGANQMRTYGNACHALGRGAAIREYVEKGTFAAPAAQGDAIRKVKVDDQGPLGVVTKTTYALANSKDAEAASFYRYLRDEVIGDDPEAIGMAPARKSGLDAACRAAIAAKAAS